MDARPPAGPGLADPALGEAHCGAVAAAFVLRLAAETHTLRSRSSAGSDPSAASICVQVETSFSFGRTRVTYEEIAGLVNRVDTTGGWTPELGDWRAWLGKLCCCGFLLLHRARARAEFCAVADFLGRLTAGQRRGLHPLFLRHLDVIRAWKLVCDETLAFWSGGDDNILRNARSLLQAGPALARCDRHVATLLRVLRSRADPGSGADAESHPSAAGDGGPAHCGEPDCGYSSSAAGVQGKGAAQALPPLLPHPIRSGGGASDLRRASRTHSLRGRGSGTARPRHPPPARSSRIVSENAALLGPSSRGGAARRPLRWLAARLARPPGPGAAPAGIGDDPGYWLLETQRVQIASRTRLRRRRRADMPPAARRGASPPPPPPPPQGSHRPSEGHAARAPHRQGLAPGRDWPEPAASRPGGGHSPYAGSFASGGTFEVSYPGPHWAPGDSRSQLGTTWTGGASPGAWPRSPKSHGACGAAPDTPGVGWRMHAGSATPGSSWPADSGTALSPPQSPR